MQLLDQATIRIIRQDAQRYGAANCWTGTTGALAAHIERLMQERAELIGIIRQQDETSHHRFFWGMLNAVIVSAPLWALVAWTVMR